MALTIRVDEEHERALSRAIQSLQSDQQHLERWSMHSVELALAIDDLEELRDRIIAAKADKAVEASGKLLRLIGTGVGRHRTW